MTADEIASIIESAAARHGVPTDALMAIANLESSGNINADNPTSSASGLFQFVDSTAREYGLTGAKRNDPAAQAEAAAKMMATNARSLERTLGRPASAGELYLAHQQGLGGARALLTNPGMSAVDALTTVYGDRNKAARAIALNGGDLNQSAGQFAGQWVNKANQRAALIPPASVPNVVATKMDVTPQTRNVPMPLPRPPTRKTAEESVRPYLTADMQVKGDNLPSLLPAQITPGLGSLTPDFFKSPSPPRRLPELPPSNIATARTVNAGIERGQAASANAPPALTAALPRYTVPASTVSQGLSNAYAKVDPGLQRALEARNAPGVGQPPATRSVPSVPTPLAPMGMTTDPGAMPTRAGFLADFGLINSTERLAGTLPPTGVSGPGAVQKGNMALTAGIYPMAPNPIPGALPAVATALDVVPDLPGFPPLPQRRPIRASMPTPMGQRPMPVMPRRASFSMPTPMAQRPAPLPTMRVTVNGAGSYSGGSSGGGQPAQRFELNGKEVRPQVVSIFNPDAPNGGAFEKRTVYR